MGRGKGTRLSDYHWEYGKRVPRSVIGDYARQIAEQFHPERIILFGSYAYGKPHRDSDVDLLVVMPAAEKVFEARLQESALPVRKIHELDDLLTLLLPHDARLQGARRGLRGLSRFAVEYVYPGFHADGRMAQTALRRAECVRLEVRT